MMTAEAARARAAALPLWSGPADPQPLGGGITNFNFTVEDRGQRFVVRIAEDLPVHQILRANEAAAARAAAAAGIGPAVVHAGPGALVSRFVEGRTLTSEAVRDPALLPRLADLLRRCHAGVAAHLRGPAPAFWVFHVVRDYAHTLREGGSRMVPALPRLLAAAGRLEALVGPVTIVFGHNDLLAGNLIDDGERLWLVDWEYAGFNSPLFDLAGVASNNGFDAAAEERLLALYFGVPVTEALRLSFAAMKCASLLREAMWSMVSEIHSRIDFDYVAYTAENLERFERAWAELDGR